MADSPSQGAARRILQRAMTMPSQASSRLEPIRRAETNPASDFVAHLKLVQASVENGAASMNLEQLIQAHKLLGDINSRLADEMSRVFANL